MCVVRDYCSASVQMMTELTPVKGGQNINSMTHGYTSSPRGTAVFECGVHVHVHVHTVIEAGEIQIMTLFMLWPQRKSLFVFAFLTKNA